MRKSALNAGKRLTALLFSALDELENSLVVLFGTQSHLRNSWTFTLIIALLLSKHSWFEIFDQFHDLAQFSLIFGLLCLLRGRFTVV